ncbi:MAG: hypothetical protein WA849_13800 [Candidatus Udaeobacter sp.]
MKIRGFLVTMFAVAFSFVPQFVNNSSAGGTYSAQLISPAAGQVVYAGQKIRVEWRSILPPINLGACEMEVWLSLDGGRTFTAEISPWMNPKSQYFSWTVPNTPTNAAVMDIRFGCEPGFPESYAPQPASTFVIAQALPALH